jgi:hypothetical protein
MPAMDASADPDADAGGDVNGGVNANLSAGTLWFRFLAGPVIYFIYFVAAWVLAEFGCLAGLGQVKFLGVNPIYAGVLAFTLIAALLTLYVGVTSYRQWRALRQAAAQANGGAPGFMLFVGIWFDAIFGVVILLTAVPMLLGSACDAL